MQTDGGYGIGAMPARPRASRAMHLVPEAVRDHPPEVERGDHDAALAPHLLRDLRDQRRVGRVPVTNDDMAQTMIEESGDHILEQHGEGCRAKLDTARRPADEIDRKRVAWGRRGP